MERGAIVQEVAALHVVLGRSQPMVAGGVSVSTQIATLRRLLNGWESRDKETGYWFRKAAEVSVKIFVWTRSMEWGMTEVCAIRV